jgi:hypothetical protein
MVGLRSNLWGGVLSPSGRFPVRRLAAAGFAVAAGLVLALIMQT